MFKWLLILIASFFIGTYAWGWNVNVRQGGMSLDGYTRYYQRQVDLQASTLWIKAKSLLIFTTPSKPVTRKAFGIE